jgi:hypothetical protein
VVASRGRARRAGGVSALGKTIRIFLAGGGHFHELLLPMHY